jgi:hypothetical protein
MVMEECEMCGCEIPEDESYYETEDGWITCYDCYTMRCYGCDDCGNIWYDQIEAEFCCEVNYDEDDE